MGMGMDSKFCKLFVVLLLLVCCSFSGAKTLVVSDIDDTIKASHVNSYRNSLRFAYATENLIKGMPGLYNHVSKNIEDVKFVYLSSAPERLMRGSHSEFLKIHNFPEGELILRKTFNFSSFRHKFKNIEELVDANNPEVLILIGDNGEGDPEVFNAVIQEYGDDIEIYQFLRRTYSKPVPFSSYKRIEFVSPLEICLNLELHGLTACPEHLLRIIADEITHEFYTKDYGAYYFHPYMDCRGYEWPLVKDLNFMSDLANLLDKKCNTI